MTLLSRLLVDEQFMALVEKYGDELWARLAQETHTAANGNGHANGHETPRHAEQRVGIVDGTVTDLTALQDRLSALEAQQEAQRALFDLLRSKIRPLALALGCCPECVMGMDACPRCSGQSKVGHFAPDYALLEVQIVNPLVARGVPLVLSETTRTGADHG